LSITSASALGITQPPVQWVSGFFPRLNWPGHDFTIHLHPMPR